MTAVSLVFLGTSELARRSLQALVRAPLVEVLGVVSQPDRAQGRGLQVRPTAVKQEALRHGLPVWQPDKLGKDQELLRRLRELSPAVFVVAAYGQLLPPAVLSLPEYGCLNVHPSLLPKYRGAAPIIWPLLNGETQTGVTIMKMDEGWDTGDILAQETTGIAATETGGQLHDRLAELGAELLVQSIPDYLQGNLQPTPQRHESASYAPKISRSDTVIDWNRPAPAIANAVRGFNPWPGAATQLVQGDKRRRLKIWEAEASLHNDEQEPGTVIDTSPQGIVVACRTGCLQLTLLQREGGKRMDVPSFLRGTPVKPGERFI